MSTELEIRKAQKELLFDLLELKHENKSRGIDVFGLEKFIGRHVAGMNSEDVSHVELQIQQIYEIK